MGWDGVAPLELRAREPKDTQAIAGVVASHLRAGDVVALTGELGAGKTCFVQGAATALGVTEPVTSPTFVLVRHLDGRLPIVHCDVYRLDTLRDVLELGDDLLAPHVVTFVEWGDAVTALLPADHFEVELRHDVSDASPGTDQRSDTGEGGEGTAPRCLTLRAYGRACERLPVLHAALAEWREEAT